MRLSEIQDSDERLRRFDAYLKAHRIGSHDLLRMSDAEKLRLRADAEAHPERYPIPLSEPGWVYHGTAHARLPAIVRDGLKPSEKSRWARDSFIGNHSLGKIFFCDRVGSALFYAKEASKTRPVLLRVPRDRLALAADPKEGEGCWFVTEPVPADAIEIWRRDRWQPLGGSK